MNFLRLIQSESYRRGTALSVIFNIISKSILFLLTIIIARYFGSNIKTDIYFFVFASMLLFSGFINNIDTAVLIPESMRMREKEGGGKATAFLNYFLLVYFIIGILFTLFMYFFGPYVFGLISKFTTADIIAYRHYFWLGSLFFIVMILTNLLNAILTSLKFFSIPMIISGINSCIVIVAILLLGSRYDVLSVFIGGLFAYAVNFFILLLLLLKIAGWSFAAKPVRVSKAVWGKLVFAELGQLTTVASSLFPLYLLSGFGSGIISVMNYGKNIADIPNTLVTSQLAGVSGIKLNEQAARHDHPGMNDSFLRISKLMVFILVPMGFYLFIFALPVAQIFYQKSSLSPAAISSSAKFLQLFAVVLFSIGINAMVSRIFIAVQAIRQAFFYQLFLNILLVATIWTCTRYYGVYGYPFGIIIINLFNFGAMYFICRRLVPFINYMALARYTGVIIVMNTVIAWGLYFAAARAQAGNWLTVIFGAVSYLIILYLLNKKFKINTELAQVLTNAK